MSEKILDVKNETPKYMERLLQELGWNEGTRIPLADSNNQELENLLLERQNEIVRLKESLILQNQKQADLNKYKANVNNEYQENKRLLFAHKNQLEQEVKIRQLKLNEAEGLERDIKDCEKKSQERGGKFDTFQRMISKLLHRADELKTEVCGERGALQEWRTAIERSSSDIAAIEQFTKQDISKVKALETKRQKLKMEHDHVHDRLTQLMSNLAAEERACERISTQVAEGMEQRKDMMQMWSHAVDNLRQRDTDIRHIREDYKVLEDECLRIAEQCREQQAFAESQRVNNSEAEKENMEMSARVGHVRVAMQHLQGNNVTLDSEWKSLQREMAVMESKLEALHNENRTIMNEQHRKDRLLSEILSQLRALKKKLEESGDKSKSAETRAKELEEMLNEEEQYASSLTHNQQRAIHCTFVEQQKLLALKNEEKLIRMQLKAAKGVMSKLASKQIEIERKIQGHKEALYIICYQVETIGARVLHMEGMKNEREVDAALCEREERLKGVLARHAARVALLERHSQRLLDDMRRLGRELELSNLYHIKLQSQLKSSMLIVTGGYKEVATLKRMWRQERVEEALMKLRVAHAARAVAGFEDTQYTLDKQRLQLDAAMNERLVEINGRRDMFNAQKRALMEDCSKLRYDIREREQRIEQLKKRYDIFIASLGKDDSDQELSVAFFKIKFAAERAELREKGAALDAEIGRCERDVSALEVTMRVVAAAHNHFLNHISPLVGDCPEMAELNELTKQYYDLRDELKKETANVNTLQTQVDDLSAQVTLLEQKCKLLTGREIEAENELDAARDRLAKQETRLQNARDVVKYYSRRAKKFIEGVDDWRLFQIALWVRDYAESAHSALNALNDICSAPKELRERFAALISKADIQRHMSKHQKRLLSFVQRLAAGTATDLSFHPEIEGSVFSTSVESEHSGLSLASGYTRRLATFRQVLATSVDEPTIAEDVPKLVRQSTVSLRVVTLGIEDNIPKCPLPAPTRSRKAFK